MKKATNLLIAFCAVLFMGCSSDDDNALAGVDPILGKWSLMTQYENEVPKELGDCQKDNFFEYKGVTLFKPNLKELIEGTNVAFSFRDHPEKLQEAISVLEEQLGNDISFVTLSEHGVFIRNRSEAYHIPAHVRNISDVSGAGDTVISVAALCLASGAPIQQVAAIANIAGGLVCEESGVVSIDKKKLLNEAKKLIVE